MHHQQGPPRASAGFHQVCRSSLAPHFSIPLSPFSYLYTHTAEPRVCVEDMFVCRTNIFIFSFLSLLLTLPHTHIHTITHSTGKNKTILPSVNPGGILLYHAAVTARLPQQMKLCFSLFLLYQLPLYGQTPSSFLLICRTGSWWRKGVSATEIHTHTKRQRQA